MTKLDRLVRAAETHATFQLRGPLWVGRCLICNGPIAFDSRTGEGATLEHIQARSRGGGEEPENLAAVHAACNSEKGVRWDPKRRRTAEEYETFVQKLHCKRHLRWRPRASDA
jgi:5-methylcytosine-specific restriction endonuclease McrA